ncbi:MAG: hypothetical protein ACLFP1_06990 [Candidatus Goldiibacteriota bacterium]
MESEFKYSKILKEKGDEFVMAYFRKYPEDMLGSSGVRQNNKGQHIKITIECKNRKCGQFDIYYEPAQSSFELDTQYIKGAAAHDAEIRVLKVWNELNVKAGL